MSYIYCIQNKINGKQYIGKTVQNIHTRFSEHVFESTKERGKQRPLYRAFNKYGIENFEISIIEKVNDISELSSREIYWIEKLNTFHFGYNATKGGDGNLRCNYEKIVQLYNEGNSMREISKILHYSVDTISNVLHCNNIQIRDSNYKRKKPVLQFTKYGILIQKFDSILDAAKYLKNSGLSKSKNISLGSLSQKIINCCNNDNYTSYGFKWKYKV